jgi:hypothetical protein
MILCTGPLCQTSAGCRCAQTPAPRGLSDYSDEEIAREHHFRMLRRLGDPRVCVSATLPSGVYSSWSTSLHCDTGNPAPR